MQEVYDRQTLHELLGVERKPRVRAEDGAGGACASRTKEAQSVREAWDGAEGEMEMEMEFESDAKVAPSHHENEGEIEQQIEYESDKSEGEVEESRYSRSSRHEPMRKRQRTGHEWQDVHTVFTSDEDDSIEEEERVYGARVNGEGALSAEQRRAYWASKGVGAQVDSE